MSVMKDKKTGKWLYYGAYPKGHPKHGKQYKKRGFKTRREAMIAEDEFLDQSINYSKYITVEKLSEEYLLHVSKRVKNSTLISYESNIKKIINRFSDTKVSELTEEILQSFFDEMDSEFSKKYVNRLYFIFNNMLNFAVRKNYLPTNILKTQIQLDARKNEVQKKMYFWEPDEFNKFIENVDNPRYYACFSFLFYMGCRKGEMMALRWNDIDFINRTVKIDKNYCYLENKITTPKTNNSYRTITIPKVLYDILVQWKERVKSFQTYTENGYIFGNGNIPLKPSTLDRNFKYYIQKANDRYNNEIPVIRIHDLRHSHASYLINNMSAGFTDFDIAKRLGDTVHTLHKTYAHWFKSGDSGIIDFMNNDI